MFNKEELAPPLPGFEMPNYEIKTDDIKLVHYLFYKNVTYSGTEQMPDRPRHCLFSFAPDMDNFSKLKAGFFNDQNFWDYWESHEKVKKIIYDDNYKLPKASL